MRQGLPNNFIRCMIEARDGSFWIGMDESVSRFDGRVFHNLTMQNGLVYFSTRALLEDRSGDIWIGTEHGVTHLHLGKPVHDAVTDGLKEEKVWALHEDADGGVWLGTRTNGLYRYRDGLLTHYTTADGLASNSIYSILEDAAQHLWLSGPFGVMLANRSELDALAHNPHQVLSMRFYRGDAGDKPTLFYGGTQPAGVMVRGEEAWFPTNRGLWRIRPTEFDVPPLTHLNLGAVTVDGRAAAVGAPLTLPAGASRVEIAYEPILLARRRMCSSATGWRIRPRLDAGRHGAALGHLHQSARGPVHVCGGGVAARTSRPAGQASMQFAKKPYFYRTPWFIALCALLAGLIAVAAYQMRIRQVHGRFEAVLAERTRLAREMHDTLIQGCASVSAMLEAAAGCAPDDAESRQHLIEYPSTQIRVAMDEARQAVWNLRGSEEGEANLAGSLQQMSQRVSREYGVAAECATGWSAFSGGPADDARVDDGGARRTLQRGSARQPENDCHTAQLQRRGSVLGDCR